MTLEGLITACAKTLTDNNASNDAADIAHAVIDLLGESLPCGYETPGVNWTMVVAPAFSGTPSDARAYAAAIIRAADSIEPAGTR